MPAKKKTKSVKKPVKKGSVKGSSLGSAYKSSVPVEADLGKIGGPHRTEGFAVGGPVRSSPVRAVSRSRRRPSFLAELWGIILWLVGVLVSLAVGFGMVGIGGNPVLEIPYIPNLVTVIAGWIVVILTVLGVLLKIVDMVIES